MYREEGVSYPWPLFTPALLVWLARMSVGERERESAAATHAYLLRNSIAGVEIFTDVQWPLTLARRANLHPPAAPFREGGRRARKIFFDLEQTFHASFFLLRSSLPSFPSFLRERSTTTFVYFSYKISLTNFIFLFIYTYIYLFFYFDIFHWILLDLFYQNSTLVIPLNPSFLPPEDSENLDS